MSQFRPTCFGVTLPVSALPAPGAAVAGPTLADAFEGINASLNAAINESRLRIRSQRRSTPAAARAFAAAAGVTPPQVFLDCGLPMVDKFPSFLATFHDSLDPKTLPIIGFGADTDYGRDAISSLWSPPSGLLSGLFADLLRVVLNGDSFLGSYYNQLNYLTRLNSGDRIWMEDAPAAWFGAYADPLNTYLADLFAGNFVDRNGTAVPLAGSTLLTNPLGVDFKQVSPQLAGGILSALIEFLGDQSFQVPYYSADILKAYRDQRDDDGALKKTNDQLTTLTAAAKAGSISAADAKDLLGITDTGGAASLPISFDLLVPGTNSPIASPLTRQVVAKLSQLDAQVQSQLTTARAADAQVAAVGTGKSSLQTKFTCDHAGTITANLQALFLFDGVTGLPQGTSVGNQDTGRSIGAGVTTPDLADFVGQVIAYAGTSAEKSVRSIMGGLVRGISIASLQNEVIAEVLGAIVGSLARKTVESITYMGLKTYIENPTSGFTAAQKLNALMVLAKLVRLPS